VALGDSVAVGSGCDCGGYVQPVGQGIGAGLRTSVAVDNLALDGQTSAGLLDQLADPDTRDAVRNADLVLVTIGANDFPEADLASADCGPTPGTSCDANRLPRWAAR
jgi:lysophospholipase L1-like esterase